MKTIASASSTLLLVLSSCGVGSLTNAFMSPQQSTYTPLSYQRNTPLTHLPSPSNDAQPQSSSQSSSTCLHLAELSGGITEAWNSYLDALEANPLLVKSITAGVILGAADLSGQALQQAIATNNDDNMELSTNNNNSNSVDIARFLRFAFFGFILQAPWNHFYYQILDGALPPTEDPFTSTTAIKVIIDQFIQAPIFTVIIFGFLGVLEGKSLDSIKEQLDEDYVDTMLANWKLWVPATAVNIAFCPPILRVLFLNVVFFFWSIFLSLKLNKD
uniref:Peroxisomal membrane protein MPV17 n=1 Tax=Skeletonema marinoi TaxID=267567 RepID=A0A7S1YNW0_9STRA|mmetsp:Transcript_494/g.778  ORF Transcript_494/g.778 Transcript_494/m.778 type:complete len:273 (+) Transcript_494:53-871(+)